MKCGEVISDFVYELSSHFFTQRSISPDKVYHATQDLLQDESYAPFVNVLHRLHSKYEAIQLLYAAYKPPTYTPGLYGIDSHKLVGFRPFSERAILKMEMKMGHQLPIQLRAFLLAGIPGKISENIDVICGCEGNGLWIDSYRKCFMRSSIEPNGIGLFFNESEEDEIVSEKRIDSIDVAGNGCDMSFAMALEGEHKGKIFIKDGYSSDIVGESFFEWFEEWIDNVRNKLLELVT